MDGEAMAASPGEVGQADKMAPAVKKAKQKTPEQKAALEDVFTGEEINATLFAEIDLGSAPSRASRQPGSRRKRAVFVMFQRCRIKARCCLQATNTQMKLLGINWHKV